MRHLVIRPAKLETENRKQVLSLQKDPTFQSVAEVDGVGKRRFAYHVVYARCQNQPEILEPIIAPY